DLPNAVVGALPRALEELEQGPHRGPGVVAADEAALAGGVDAGNELAVYVELELSRGRVAEAYGLRALVAGEPGQVHLGEAAAAADVVHDRQIGRRAGDGTQQPVAELARLVEVAAEHQRVEREARVAQPDEAVVPVAHASDLLREGGRRRGDD